jgi:catechol 2,3-dioxygenase-like lactoylglutathione lyase family enzyme
MRAHVLIVGIFCAGLLLGADVLGAEAPELRIKGVGINVSDLDRSVMFYTQAIGLKEIMRVPVDGPTREIVLSDSGNIEDAIVVLAKLDAHPLVSGREGFGRIILNVADANALAKRITAAGHKATLLHIPEPGGPRVYFAEDPDGYLVELYQHGTADVP